LAPNRQRLQRDGTTVSPYQDLGSKTDAKGGIATRAHIISSQRALTNLHAWCKHSPGQCAASGNSDIDANAPYFALVGVLRDSVAGAKDTPHILARAKHQSDPRTGIAD